jgi:two-component system nitrogen regulation sensor histidine kinase NtrY
MEFVDNYRELTNLPTPVKNKVTIKSLLEESVQIMKPLLSENKITLVLEAIDENLSVYIDAKLMERVLVNLITNSMHALQNSNNKTIKLSVERKNSRTFISITDNGCGIETEIKDKIFIPFFTTRINGGGIGLTLAKIL